jgi:DNA polymerase III delta prime subunit
MERIMFNDFDSKYTPKTLNDIVFQTEKTRKIAEGLTNGTFGFPMSGINGVLLYGVYGSGKSALAKIMPQIIEKANGGEEAFVKYFNIAQGGDNGASVIDSIKRQASLVSFQNKYHYFVLDEVDNLRADSMTSLKVAMNINAMNCVYILTTNILSKVEGGVKNRCVLLEFNSAASTEWLPKFKSILADYGVTDIADDLLLDVIEACNGSARQIMLAARRLIVEKTLLAA